MGPGRIEQQGGHPQLAKLRDESSLASQCRVARWCEVAKPPGEEMCAYDGTWTSIRGRVRRQRG